MRNTVACVSSVGNIYPVDQVYFGRKVGYFFYSHNNVSMPDKEKTSIPNKDSSMRPACSVEFHPEWRQRPLEPKRWPQ